MKTPFLITILLLLINIVSFSQKPRKIFTALQEKNITEAIVEFQKIDASKNYDVEELTLFELSKCHFMIDSSYQDYNPIESIKNFNKTIQNPVFSQKTDNTLKEVNEFLSKYETSIIQIENNIHQKIVFQAKKINTIEAYSRALEVTNNIHRLELETLKEEASYKVAKSEMSITGLKSFISNYSNSKHITEVQFLLEKLLLETAQKKQSIEDLNAFIKEYNSSVLIPKAIDFRDSIVLLRTPKEYESIQTFINTYPNSKFNVELKASLPDLLYKAAIDKNTIESFRRFINTFPSDSRVENIKMKLDEKKIIIIELDKKYECYAGLKSDDNYNDLIPIADENMENFMLLDSLGHIVQLSNEIIEVDFFREGLARVVLSNNKKGFIDKNGKIQIPIIYDEVRPFENNLSIVKLNQKEGVINKSGEIILPIIYESLYEIVGNYICYKLNENYGFGVMDFSGNEVLPMIYKEILINENLAYCINIENKAGVIDLTNNRKIVIPFIYDYVNIFKNEIAIVSLNDKRGAISKTNRVIIPIKYNNVIKCENNLFIVKVKNKCGIIDSNENIMVPFNYDYINEVGNNLFGVLVNQKLGYINNSNKIIHPIIYNKINLGFLDFVNGFVIVSLDGKYGCIDNKGNTCIPFEYGYSMRFSNDLLVVHVKDKCGLIDIKTKKIVLPFEYDSCHIFGLGGRGLFTKNDLNKSFYIKQNW